MMPTCGSALQQVPPFVPLTFLQLRFKHGHASPSHTVARLP